MKKNLIVYCLVLLFLFLIDTFWISFVAKNFYLDRLHFILVDPINWIAVIPFYFLYALGLFVFVVLPCASDPDLHRSISLGALFGLVAYSTYDFTNWATIKEWPAILTFVDLTWGALLSASVCAFSLFFMQHLFPKTGK